MIARTTLRQRRARIALVAIACVLLLVSSAAAQSIWARGGTSTLVDATGVEATYSFAPVKGWVGIGTSHGFVLGGYAETKFRNIILGGGDQYQSLSLATDAFEQGRYFSGRGVVLRYNTDRDSLQVFGGRTSRELSYDFFRAFESVENTGALFYTHTFSPKVQYTSFNVIQGKFSSIHSLRFTPRKEWEFGVSAGSGYDAGYGALSGHISGDRYDLTTSYSKAGDSFQRIGGVMINAPERDGANARFAYRLGKTSRVSVAHENFVSPDLNEGETPMRVSLDTFNASTSLKGFGIGYSATRSESGPYFTNTQTVNASRSFLGIMTASGSFARMDQTSRKFNLVTADLQEKISPRLQLRQGITHQDGNSNFVWGVRFLSNRMALALEHDFAYTPLAGNNRYANYWNVNLNLQIAGSIRLHTQSFIDPKGRVRYTAYFDGLGFARGGEQMRQSTPSINPNLGKFVVRGMVRDVQGKPVWGIAIQIDGQSVFSDNSGNFFVRFRRGERYPLTVMPDRSLNTQYYEVVEAPVSVLAETEDMAQPVIITLRRAAAPPAPPKKKRSELEPDGQGEQPVIAGLTPDPASE